MPTIAGASSFFIEEQMAAYRDEARPSEKSKFRSGDTSRAPKDMCEIAKGLSEEQVQAIAGHYAEQKFVPAKQQVDLAKAAQGGIVHGDLCEKCHTEAGSVAEDDAGILAGQWMPYMQQSFKEYRTDKRPDIKKMTTAFGKISDADVEALIHYYACMGNAQAGTVKPEQCAAAK
jgi:sulfide dehydrogenase cytochrome subunit